MTAVFILSINMFVSALFAVAFAVAFVDMELEVTLGKVAFEEASLAFEVL